MKVYYFPLEPMETRYTADWWHMFDEVFTHNDVEFIKLAPPSPMVRTDGTNFLDWGHSFRYKSQQLQQFFQQAKNIKKDDWVFFADGEFPGIEMLEYWKKLEDKKFKIATIWHAGTYDPNDLTYQKGLRKIGKHCEYVWFEICDKIFVATEFHKKMILRGAEYSLKKELDKKIIVTGLPIYTDKLKSKIKSFEDKDIDVLFGGRLSSEKGFDKVRTMQEAGVNITIALKENWTRDEWYDALSRSKILFAPSLQETFGYNTTEALAIGTMPVTSSAEVFKEYVPEGCMAEFHSTGNYTDLINHFLKHGYNPETLPKNIQKYDYKTVIGTMIEEMKK